VVGRGGHHVAVPRHDPLKTGTLAAILRQCGIDETRWKDL